MADHDARLVPLEDLVPYGRNPRRGDIGAIRESLRANGQYRPIVVLLGLVRKNEGIAARVLLDFNADSEKVRNEVLRAMGTLERELEDPRE